MKKKNMILIYPLILMGFVLILANSCKKKEETPPPVVVTIGQSYQGGVVAYILMPTDIGYDENVQHGLIAAASDQSIGAEWGCYGTALSGADDAALSAGNQNTIDIMNGCSESGIAARLCGDLVLAGYSDWYLPSRVELARIYENRVAIGGFANLAYWSSTEVSNYDAYYQGFGNGVNSYGSKDYKYYVRAVRAF